jgi:hypothetical protein
MTTQFTQQEAIEAILNATKDGDLPLEDRLVLLCEAARDHPQVSGGRLLPARLRAAIFPVAAPRTAPEGHRGRSLYARWPLLLPRGKPTGAARGRNTVG